MLGPPPLFTWQFLLILLIAGQMSSAETRLGPHYDLLGRHAFILHSLSTVTNNHSWMAIGLQFFSPTGRDSVLHTEHLVQCQRVSGSNTWMNEAGVQEILTANERTQQSKPNGTKVFSSLSTN
jgi:hypothetical protein